jgi:hypothetical protein
MKDWSEWRGKLELSSDKFRSKVTTILETAKRNFRSVGYVEDKDTGGKENSDQDEQPHLEDE